LLLGALCFDVLAGWDVTGYNMGTLMRFFFAKAIASG
jgi:hypothetical protein